MNESKDPINGIARKLESIQILLMSLLLLITSVFGYVNVSVNGNVEKYVWVAGDGLTTEIEEANDYELLKQIVSDFGRGRETPPKRQPVFIVPVDTVKIIPDTLQLPPSADIDVYPIGRSVFKIIITSEVPDLFDVKVVNSGDDTIRYQSYPVEVGTNINKLNLGDVPRGNYGLIVSNGIIVKRLNLRIK